MLDLMVIVVTLLSLLVRNGFTEGGERLEEEDTMNTPLEPGAGCVTRGV